MFSTSNSQYLNDLISEMRRLSEMPVDCKNARILLSREISRVFDEVQKIGAFGEVRTPDPARPIISMSHFEPHTTSTPYASKPRYSLSPLSLSNLSHDFVTPIKKFSGNQEGDWHEHTPESPQDQSDMHYVLQTKIYIPDPPQAVDGHEVKCNYIGRIIGPSGMTSRTIEKEFNVTLLVRGAGSIRNKEAVEILRGRKGYEHLNEPSHVLLIARHQDRDKVLRRRRFEAATQPPELMPRVKRDGCARKNHARQQQAFVLCLSQGLELGVGSMVLYNETKICEEMLDAAATKVESLLTPVHDELKKGQLVSYAIMSGTYEMRSKKQVQVPRTRPTGSQKKRYERRELKEK